MEQAPVRICCGQRHYGAICPDEKVMCCVCFDRVDIAELKTLPNGKKEDVCLLCAEKESAAGCRKTKFDEDLYGGRYES